MQCLTMILTRIITFPDIGNLSFWNNHNSQNPMPSIARGIPPMGLQEMCCKTQRNLMFDLSCPLLLQQMLQKFGAVEIAEMKVRLIGLMIWACQYCLGMSRSGDGRTLNVLQKKFQLGLTPPHPWIKNPGLNHAQHGFYTCSTSTH